jgi:hypothetical protein
MIFISQPTEFKQFSQDLYHELRNVSEYEDFNKTLIQTINKISCNLIPSDQIKETETKILKETNLNEEEWINQNNQFEIEKKLKRAENRKLRLEERKKAKEAFPDKTLSKTQVSKLYFFEKKISKQEHGLYKKIYTLVRNNFDYKNGHKNFLQYTSIQPIFELACYSNRQVFRTLKKLLSKKIVYKVMINREVRIYLNPFKCHCDKTESDTKKRKNKALQRQQIIENKQQREKLKAEQKAKNCITPNNKLSNLEKKYKREREYLKIDIELRKKYIEKKNKITKKLILETVIT